MRLKTASTTFTNASQPMAETTSDETSPLAAPPIASEEEADAERDARGRAGGRDPELRAGGRHRAAELGDAAEQPERDALDLHPVAPGDDRVRELVGEQRGEEERSTATIATTQSSRSPTPPVRPKASSPR